MEKAARLLLGAASGGVLGLVLSGMFRAGAWVAAGVTVIAAAGLALLSSRLRPSGPPPPPRSVWAGICGGTAILIALAVLFMQSFYIQSATLQGKQPELPLPIWPVSRSLLWITVLVAGLGMLSGMAGWMELQRERGKYRGGSFIATGFLACVSSIALAAACYTMGYGLPFLR